MPGTQFGTASRGAQRHIEEVAQVVDGGDNPRDLAVRESWKRCVSVYGLDPGQLQDAYIVPDARLREHRERLEQLTRTARHGLERLYQQVRDQEYVVLLADDRGVTVDYIGDPVRHGDLHRAGLTLGSEWSEARAGTCAVGSCIATGESMVIHQDDHFDATHMPLTCTAAPIHDAHGQLVAVLDISAMRSPQPKRSQWLALQLVQDAARRIELAHLISSFREDWILRLGRSATFVDVEPDAALAVNSAGRIVGMTHAARRLLAQAEQRDWRTQRVPLGRRLDEFFELDDNDLPRLMGGVPPEDRALRLHDGRQLFALATAPQPALRRQHKPATALLPAALARLSGGDPQMDRMLQMAARLAQSRLSVLLHGETGSGKEKLARALHDASLLADPARNQHNSPFIAVNCAALPETLIESELFGYAPGAFTGAKSRGRKGLIEAAHGGTLFLDEIGDMPLELQARLLRVLAEQEVLPVGATRPVPVDVRIIAASHRHLPDQCRAGRFREDLYFRLSTATLQLPPLRQRQDLAWLIDQLLAEGRPLKLDRSARGLLLAHDWPGNIRQLRNVIELARVLSIDGVVSERELPELAPPLPTGSQTASTELPLSELLRQHSWNVTAVARTLGVDRGTIHRRMRRQGLIPPQRRRFD